MKAETGKTASFTNRIIKCDDQVVIGGTEKYEALDRKTYLEKNN